MGHFVSAQASHVTADRTSGIQCVIISHMTVVRRIATYADERGNRILFSGPPITASVHVLFRGSNNVLTVDPGAHVRSLNLRFDCDNGEMSIGPSQGVAGLRAVVRIGQDARVRLGRNVSTTNAVQLSAVEGTSIDIGDDVMIAGNVKIRGDDGHPIFDVRTGARVNPARSINIGDHVWLGLESTLLGGTNVGSGSVVGTRALVKGAFPNNCIVAGVPAKVIRRDVAWERPHLSVAKPFYKPNADSVTRSAYWDVTRD